VGVNDERPAAAGAEALLTVWETVTGMTLPAHQKLAFMARSEVPGLASKPLGDLVLAADRVKSPHRLRLDEWLRAVERLHETKPHVDDERVCSEGYLGKARGDDRTREYVGDYRGLRSRDGRFPQRPLDADLHKLMPRPQSYDDTF
jgi:hypothetical protein